MPLFGFKERVRATVRMQTEHPFAGNVRLVIVNPHPDMSEADLLIGLCSYFYVRALNMAEREPAQLVHKLAMHFVRRLERSAAQTTNAATLPDALGDLAPLVASDAVANGDALELTIALGIANNGMSPGTIHVKKNSWRTLFQPTAVLLMLRDLGERLGAEDQARLALALRGIAQEYERRGDVHGGISEAAVADPGLVAAGVWKHG